MRLRRALDDYKRVCGHETRFPGERRTTNGLFSGLDDRLVFVGEDGSLRDHSYPLTGLFGIERTRFGIETADGCHWFEDMQPVSQSYRDGTALVETSYERGGLTVVQRDLTVGRTHVTQFELSGEVPPEASLRAFVAFAPDGQEGQVSRLHHERAVEVYHDSEHDYVATGTAAADQRGQTQESLAELLDESVLEYPRGDSDGRYEDDRVSGYVDLTVPFEHGTATLGTLLTDVETVDRETALDRLTSLTERLSDTGAIRQQAREQVAGDDAPVSAESAISTDRRVLRLLASDLGVRAAGPDPDPFYQHSGGYGYTWFRDDAEIATALLQAEDALAPSFSEHYSPNLDVYLETQLPDGSWPHRIWPYNARLAPGWANARIEAAAGDADYQADQTASVVRFLATALRERESETPDAASGAIERGIESLDESLAADGLPKTCQNAWENMTGRFAHTAATFLGAYAAVARAPVGEAGREHALQQAQRIYAALDDLWSAEREAFGMRLVDGVLDDRLDSGSLALLEAHREFAAVADLDDRRVDRLAAHYESLREGLTRETDDVRGLIRFEGDEWRTRTQSEPKVWTVSTVWSAKAGAELATMLAERDGARAGALFAAARADLAEVMPGGSLTAANGYLPEQRFDDGTADCATPLGWPHALRTATIALLDQAGERDAETPAATSSHD